MKFKEWLKIKENATTTADVANFQMPVGGMIRRQPSFLGGREIKRKKKNIDSFKENSYN